MKEEAAVTEVVAVKYVGNMRRSSGRSSGWWERGKCKKGHVGVEEGGSVRGKEQGGHGNGSRCGQNGAVAIDPADADCETVVGKYDKVKSLIVARKGEISKRRLFNGSPSMVMLRAPATSPPESEFGCGVAGYILQPWHFCFSLSPPVSLFLLNSFLCALLNRFFQRVSHCSLNSILIYPTLLSTWWPEKMKNSNADQVLWFEHDRTRGGDKLSDGGAGCRGHLLVRN